MSGSYVAPTVLLTFGEVKALLPYGRGTAQIQSYLIDFSRNQPIKISLTAANSIDDPNRIGLRKVVISNNNGVSVVFGNPNGYIDPAASMVAGGLLEILRSTQIQIQQGQEEFLLPTTRGIALPEVIWQCLNWQLSQSKISVVDTRLAWFHQAFLQVAPYILPAFRQAGPQSYPHHPVLFGAPPPTTPTSNGNTPSPRSFTHYHSGASSSAAGADPKRAKVEEDITRKRAKSQTEKNISPEEQRVKDEEAEVLARAKLSTATLDPYNPGGPPPDYLDGQVIATPGQLADGFFWRTRILQSSQPVGFEEDPAEYAARGREKLASPRVWAILDLMHDNEITPDMLKAGYKIPPDVEPSFKEIESIIEDIKTRLAYLKLTAGKSATELQQDKQDLADLQRLFAVTEKNATAAQMIAILDLAYKNEISLAMLDDKTKAPKDKKQIVKEINALIAELNPPDQTKIRDLIVQGPIPRSRGPSL